MGILLLKTFLLMQTENVVVPHTNVPYFKGRRHSPLLSFVGVMEGLVFALSVSL